MSEFATHRQLAKWCAQGKGEWKHFPSNSGTVYTTYKYDEKIADCYLVDGITATRLIVVRRWEDSSWYAPTKEYLKR